MTSLQLYGLVRSVATRHDDRSRHKCEREGVASQVAPKTMGELSRSLASQRTPARLSHRLHETGSFVAEFGRGTCFAPPLLDCEGGDAPLALARIRCVGMSGGDAHSAPSTSHRAGARVPSSEGRGGVLAEGAPSDPSAE